jgi:hypothetical protein
VFAFATAYTVDSQEIERVQRFGRCRQLDGRAAILTVVARPETT